MKKHLMLFLIFSLVSCERRKNNYWSEVDFDVNIYTNPAFQQMDKEDFLSLSENPAIKKTSNVRYNLKRLDLVNNMNQDNTFENLACLASFKNSDTLSIDIGSNSLFSGFGFVLSCFDKKFISRPYSYLDVIVEDETFPVYKIISQKLTLNKSKYSIGDSLYGTIEFRIIETKDKRQIKHAANGSFRTRITKNNSFLP